MARIKYKLLIHSAEQVVQVVKNGEKLTRGREMGQVAVLERNSTNGISMAISMDGHILEIDYDDKMLKKYKPEEFEINIDATGKCVLPGLVDAHTHPVWAGDRVNEFSMKLAGATYMDIHNAGGGIYSTVANTRKATEETLIKSLKTRLNEMLKSGTTLVEAKSGYGLEPETEIKMLRVLHKMKQNSTVEVSPTFCGAHAIPSGKTPEEATQSILNEHLPRIKLLVDSKEISVDSIDVFCEKGVFEIEHSEKILKAGRDLGFRLNFHGDELHPLGAAEMGAKLNAEAISHLEEISDSGIQAMSKSSTIAVVLPTTAYLLKLNCPPVRKMIEARVPIALGTDFNPNAFCTSMPLVMHLACVLMNMTMGEALNAATINAAAVLGKSEMYGSLEKGKFADAIIINATRWEHLVYQLGAHSLIRFVIKKGCIVYEGCEETLM